MKQPETNKYQDILHLSRPRSQRHPPMSAHDRAGQFSPFAALTGFEAAIAETQRLTDSRITLEEGVKELLDQRMQEILERIETQPMVQILWFRYDPRKTGGEYITHIGRVNDPARISSPASRRAPCCDTLLASQATPAAGWPRTPAATPVSSISPLRASTPGTQRRSISSGRLCTSPSTIAP